jgi:hypothetical protein
MDGHHVIGHTGGAPGMNAALTTGYPVVVLSNMHPPQAMETCRYISERLP